MYDEQYPYMTKLDRDILKTQRAALGALSYVPKRSKYWGYIRELMELEKAMNAARYLKLRNRLMRFHGDDWGRI